VKKPFKNKTRKSRGNRSDNYSNEKKEITAFNNQPPESIKVSEITPADKINESVISQMLENSAISNLSSAKAHWYFGEWQALVDIDIQAHSNQPDVEKLAALKAAAYQQLDDIENSKIYFKLAKDLGCDKYLISQLLIAGVHNALGRVAALKQDDERMLSHFTAAVDVGGKSQEAKLEMHARSVKEIAKLGLLPQAAKLLSSKKEQMNLLLSRPSDNNATFKVLSSEVEIINHELMLAYQKSQLYSSNEEEVAKYNNDGTVNVERLKKLSPSQLGQDLWVLEQTNYKKGGFFVEFGATDGVLLSNSYLLEKEFAWQGLCAEPNPNYYQQLIMNRNCLTSDSCIAAKTGESVEFILANEYGGIASYADDDAHADKRAAYKKEGRIVELTTISLHDFLCTNNAPKEIDYISIDTEGSELDILKSFPFEKWKVSLFSIEHNFTENRVLIRELLEAHDYQCIETKFDDWYKLNKVQEEVILIPLPSGKLSH